MHPVPHMTVRRAAALDWHHHGHIWYATSPRTQDRYAVDVDEDGLFRVAGSSPANYPDDGFLYAAYDTLADALGDCQANERRMVESC